VRIPLTVPCSPTSLRNRHHASFLFFELITVISATVRRSASRHQNLGSTISFYGRTWTVWSQHKRDSSDVRVRSELRRVGKKPAQGSPKFVFLHLRPTLTAQTLRTEL